MLTYPKSPMRVRRMPMHLSSGHVTLMPGKFYPPPSNFPQSDLGRRADSRWALPQISSLFTFKHTRIGKKYSADVPISISNCASAAVYLFTCRSFFLQKLVAFI